MHKNNRRQAKIIFLNEIRLKIKFAAKQANVSTHMRMRFLLFEPTMVSWQNCGEKNHR
jgi:hypothetical protein